MPLSCRDTARVYPRVCGGTAERNLLHKRSGGLSPRVRGNLLAMDDDTETAGSIPACAGEPDVGIWEWRERQVYPRVCGGTLWRRRRL